MHQASLVAPPKHWEIRWFLIGPSLTKRHAGELVTALLGLLAFMLGVETALSYAADPMLTLTVRAGMVTILPVVIIRLALAAASTNDTGGRALLKKAMNPQRAAPLIIIQASLVATGLMAFSQMGIAAHEEFSASHVFAACAFMPLVLQALELFNGALKEVRSDHTFSRADADLLTRITLKIQLMVAAPAVTLVENLPDGVVLSAIVPTCALVIGFWTAFVPYVGARELTGMRADAESTTNTTAFVTTTT